MNNWDDYRLILELAREGTLRGTADALGINHSTVSRRLAALNKQFGTPVFERDANGYKPTDIGCDLIEDAEKMGAIALRGTRLRQAALSDVAGTVTISVPVAIGQFLVLSELEAFEQQYPDVKLVVYSSNEIADLDKAEADVVIRGTQNPADHLVGRRLFPYALSYYCNREYLANTPPENRRWIVSESIGTPTDWIEKTPLPQTPIGLRIQDISLRHQAVISGYGMSRGACYMADLEPNLMRLHGSQLELGPDLWVLTHPNLKDVPRIRAIMRFMSNILLKQKKLILGQSYCEEGRPLTPSLDV